ncbi:serine/threonine-protein kinase [Streptomyces xanthophaeus]
MSTVGPAGRVRPALPGDPARIGPYRIIGRLGAGGMGTVHAALDAGGQRVAVKVIRTAQAEDPEFRARFRREVQLSARVTGPCLVPLLAADPDAPAPWLATAYAPGPTLDQHLAVHGPLAGGNLYAFAAGTAQALAAIHRAGVVHRDVKPQNVILSPAGPRVLDFGIAHAADGTSVTRTGVMTGTPGWISPEHYRTGTAGPPGDMFAWGALVSYAATGRLPFGTGAPDVVAFRVMSGEADLDGVPGPLLTLLVRALAKEPEGRLTSEDAAGQCTALLASQTTLLLTSTPTTAGDPVAAQWDLPALDDPAWQGPPVRPRRRPLLTVGIGAALVGGLAGGLLALSPQTRQERTAHSAPPTAPTGTGRATAAPPSAPPSGTQAGAGTGASPAADDSPSITTWRQARAAQTPAENDAGPSMGTGPWLDPVAHPDQDRALTFHRPRGEVYVALSGQELDQGAVHDIAELACLGLRDLSTAYPDLPYRTYVVVDTEREGGPAVVWSDDFRANPSCSTSLTDRAAAPGEGRATDWYPGSAGMLTAVIPSRDPDQIRVAHRIATTIITSWNGGAGHDRIGHDTMSVGFDPGSRTMYVWATEPRWDAATRGAWAREAAAHACTGLTAEAGRSADWPFTRYAVLVRDTAGTDEYLRWATVGTCPD